MYKQIDFFPSYTGAPDAARFFLLADRDKQRLIN